MLLEPAKIKRIQIGYHLPEDLEIFADINLFQTIIRNLVSNAVKFTPRGGIISISAERYDNENVVVSIRDSGIGMSRVMVDD